MTPSQQQIMGPKQGFKARNDLHIVRKLWHMGTGLSGLGVYLMFGFEKREMATILLGLSAAAFIVELARLNFQKVNNIVMILMGPFMRESERDGLSGFPFYALGAGLSLFFFSEKIAILSILFLIFSDPISSFFGVLLGREKILPNKSLQGSLAGFITCYLVTLFYLNAYEQSSIQALAFALFAGLIGSVSELLSIFVDDNLTIPVFSGFGLTILNEIFVIF
ncbi:MAG: phosphatidate cytidylyltransferase [Bacteriovoracaceae bacterium]|nr:phosphatidate cytidylyltransferase [Bacteriovoracaceae bacterium]